MTDAELAEIEGKLITVRYTTIGDQPIEGAEGRVILALADVRLLIATVREQAVRIRQLEFAKDLVPQIMREENDALSKQLAVLEREAGVNGKWISMLEGALSTIVDDNHCQYDGCDVPPEDFAAARALLARQSPAGAESKP